MTPTRAELEQLAQSPEGRRQIDALAAGVMGWTHRTNNDVMGTTNDDLAHDEYWRDKGDQLDDCWWYKDSAGDWRVAAYAVDQPYECDAWSPTTSIADAWQLVDALWAKHEWRLWLEPSWQGQWSGLCYHKGTFIAQSGWFEEATLAITIAAILAGGEKEKA